MTPATASPCPSHSGGSSTKLGLRDLRRHYEDCAVLIAHIEASPHADSVIGTHSLGHH